jgi:serine/threonine protein phosphatase PrpC
MKIIKIPKPIQLLRYKHPSHLSIKTHKPLKIRTTFNTKSILPPLLQSKPTLYSNHKYSSINLCTSLQHNKQLHITSSHKIKLPSLNSSLSPDNKHQPCFSNDTPRKATIHSTIQPKKLISTPRQIHSITLAGLDRNNCPKQNQDNSIILKNVFNNSQYDIICVLDGHGTYGHLVSEFLKKEIETYFVNNYIFQDKLSNNILSKLIGDNFSFLKTFNTYLQHQLINTSNINIEFSGSTCILLFIINNCIIISNTGDSRAIIVSQSFKGNAFVTQMSVDHKPNLPKEKERIIKEKGEVFREEQDEPYRVWCKGKDYPGIAMSRSLGDAVAKTIGVCYEPEIMLRNIHRDNMYIIVASDGLWDVLSNQQVEEIVTPFYHKNDCEGACEELLNVTKKKYENEFENGRDDITIIIYFFQKKMFKYTYKNSVSLTTNQSYNKLL